MSPFASTVAKRLALLALGTGMALAMLALVEGGLRLLGVGEGPRRHDPFVGFSNLVPMFERAVREDGTAIYRTAAARNAPVPAEFTVDKPPGAFRIFVVGGSSSAGTPYDYRLAFSGWLARRLEAELPHTRTEVVNASLDAYASRRILAVVREIAQHEPDLLIVYSGHNEIAESRYYAHLTDLDHRLFRLWTWLAGTRIYTLLADSALMQRATEFTRGDPVAFGDQANALQYFATADERLGGARESEREALYRELHYRNNIEAMIEAVHEVGGELLLVTLSQNFADWPPGASSHRADLSEAERSRWQTLVDEGNRHAGAADCAAALERYAQALAIDEQYAGLHFEIASCERALGRAPAAARHYRLASDLDRVPNGAPTRYNEVLRELALEHGTLLADVELLLAEESAGGLVGDQWFTDLVHPNLRGHQRIAAALADVLREAGLPVEAERWQPAAYRDPDVDALYAADPTLRLRERTVRAVACMLTRRRACALENAHAVLAAQPENEAALRVVRSFEAARDAGR